MFLNQQVRGGGMEPVNGNEKGRLSGYTLFEDELPEHIRRRLHEILPHPTHRGKEVSPEILETYMKLDFIDRFLQMMKNEAWRVFDTGDARLQQLAERYEYPTSDAGFTAFDEEQRRMLLRDKELRDEYGEAMVSDMESRAAEWLRYEGHIREEDRKYLSHHFMGFTRDSFKEYLDQYKEQFSRAVWTNTIERRHFQLLKNRIAGLPFSHYELNATGQFVDRGKLEELLDYASQDHPVPLQERLDVDITSAQRATRYLQLLKRGHDPDQALDEAGIEDYLRTRPEDHTDYLDPAVYKKRPVDDEHLDHYAKEL